MTDEMNDFTLLNSFFSDETEAFRSPSEPEAGDTVTIRLRTAPNAVQRAMLYFSGNDIAILMKKVDTDNGFDWYEAKVVCVYGEVNYSFVVETADCRIIYNKLGAKVCDITEQPEKAYAFRFTPGFHVPEWSKGAVQYQIFTDRFRNGNPDNDVSNNEYWYINGHSKHVEWDALPDDTDIRTFHGGDLQGVLEKLDYLQSLGVEVIYFNPLFISPSSHKYDTQDYDSIDPHFAVIVDDVDASMQDWETHNGYAPRYIRRVTSLENRGASNVFFAGFCQEVHRRGMKIILDGVFNHCGSYCKWMDREGIYLEKPGYEKGAYQDPKSPYRDYFRFNAKGSPLYADYEGWWGHATLPKLNYEGSPELQEKILNIAEKWALPPYSIDGWRLDVAADLGHSPEYNHSFWREFRSRLKKVNPDLLIIAEHYGNAADWLHGDQWDTVMNYDAFMEPLSYFLTGMEKHSDYRRDDLYLNGEAFFSSMRQNMAVFEFPSLQCAMNELSNHDHSRFLTRTSRKTGRLENAGSEAAGTGLNKAVFREAVVMQMTWPGAPTIYYGDEAGQVGWTDPDNRRTYPWGKEDLRLVELHRALTALRKEHPVLKTGSFVPLYGGYGLIAYARFNPEEILFVTVNPSEEDKQVSLWVRAAGAEDGQEAVCILSTGREDFDTKATFIGRVERGALSVVVPAMMSGIYSIKK